MPTQEKVYTAEEIAGFIAQHFAGMEIDENEVSRWLLGSSYIWTKKISDRQIATEAIKILKEQSKAIELRTFVPNELSRYISYYGKGSLAILFANPGESPEELSDRGNSRVEKVLPIYIEKRNNEEQSDKTRKRRLTKADHRNKVNKETEDDPKLLKAREEYEIAANNLTEAIAKKVEIMETWRGFFLEAFLESDDVKLLGEKRGIIHDIGQLERLEWQISANISLEDNDSQLHRTLTNNLRQATNNLRGEKNKLMPKSQQLESKMFEANYGEVSTKLIQVDLEIKEGIETLTKATAKLKSCRRGLRSSKMRKMMKWEDVRTHSLL